MPELMDVRIDGEATWVTGEVELSTADAFAEAVAAAIRAARAVDLAGVTFMDSSGLKALLAAAGASNGTPLVLRNPSLAVRRLLEITIPDGAPGLEIRSGED